jgi:hypothetical protein
VPADHSVGLYDDSRHRSSGTNSGGEAPRSRSKEFSFGRGRFRLRTATRFGGPELGRRYHFACEKKTRMVTRYERKKFEPELVVTC